MPTITALISIPALYIILVYVLVLLVRNRNSACGHARNRNQTPRFTSLKAA